MVVDSMTYQEIANEFKIDFKSFIHPKLKNSFGMDNKYRRYMLKEAGEQAVFFKPIEFTSKKGNHYVIQFNSKGRSNYKKRGLLFIIYMYYYRPEGIYAVLLSGSKLDMFSFYTPHFFDRYRERFLNDTNKPKLQTIAKYFRDNATCQAEDVDNPKYPNSLFTVTNEGVSLGERINMKMHKFRTFISFDMLKGNQVNAKEIHEESLKFYLEYIQ